MVGISVPDWVKETYESRGWRQQHPSNLSRRYGVKVMTSPDQSRAVVAIPPVRIKPPAVCGSSAQAQFDRYLRNVQRGMERILDGGVKIQDVYFTGGGTLVIPEWFTAWCEKHGIKIHVVELRIPAKADSGSGDGGQCRSVATQGRGLCIRLSAMVQRRALFTHRFA